MNSALKISNQRGQGSVEYVLILGLTVAIVLGILLQFNKAAKVWADNYFGDYLTCLLETGELPSLGGPGSGECAAEFKPFSLADGGGKGGKDGSGNGGGSEDSDKDDDADSDSSSSTAGRTGAADGGGASAAGSSTTGRGTRIAVNPKKDDADEKDGKKGDEVGEGADFNTFNQNKSSKRILVVQTEEQRKRRIEEAKKDKTRSKVKTEADLGDGRQGAPVLQKVTKRQLASADDSESGFEFTFGNVFRWLLIIALILAIVIFIGGQLLQVSKSVD